MYSKYFYLPLPHRVLLSIIHGNRWQIDYVSQRAITCPCLRLLAITYFITFLFLFKARAGSRGDLTIKQGSSGVKECNETSLHSPGRYFIFSAPC